MGQDGFLLEGKFSEFGFREDLVILGLALGRLAGGRHLDRLGST